MTDTTLEPKLTKQDLRVLAAVSEEPIDHLRGKLPAVSLWQIAERLRLQDVSEAADLELTLSGLWHLGYVDSIEKIDGRRVYWRTRKGDEAVREAAK